MPALLNAMSRPPNVSTVAPSAAWTASLSVTSQVTAIARPPFASMRRTVSRLSASMSPATATCAPSSAKRSAVARPIAGAATRDEGDLPAELALGAHRVCSVLGRRPRWRGAPSHDTWFAAVRKSPLRGVPTGHPTARGPARTLRAWTTAAKYVSSSCPDERRSPRTRSGCPPAATGVCPGCDAARSPRWPGSASSTTPRSNAAPSTAPPSRSSTPSPERCNSTTPNESTSPTSPAPPTAPRPPTPRPPPLARVDDPAKPAMGPRRRHRRAGVRAQRSHGHPRRQPARPRLLHRPLRRPRRPPNIARFTFLDPAGERFYPDWDSAADICVAILRTEAGRDPHDRRSTTSSASSPPAATSSAPGGEATTSATTAPAPNGSTTPSSASSPSPTKASRWPPNPASPSPSTPPNPPHHLPSASSSSAPGPPHPQRPRPHTPTTTGDAIDARGRSMARVLVTGSTTGLGLAAAHSLARRRPRRHRSTPATAASRRPRTAPDSLPTW